jgi:hypothetical protein
MKHFTFVLYRDKVQARMNQPKARETVDRGTSPAESSGR